MISQKRERPAVAGPGAGGEHVGYGAHGQYTPATRLLPLLDGVRQAGPYRWIARCPAHCDRHPSLSVRETEDGTLLLRCWTGCAAADVVAATGLTLADLFPRGADDRGPLRRGERWVPRDVLACLAREAVVLAIAGDDIAAGRPLSTADRARVRSAAMRLMNATQEVGHG